MRLLLPLHGPMAPTLNAASLQAELRMRGHGQRTRFARQARLSGVEGGSPELMRAAGRLAFYHRRSCGTPNLMRRGRLPDPQGKRERTCSAAPS